MNHQDILKLQEKIKSISDLKAKIESLVAELAAIKDELAQYKSVVSSARRIWSWKMTVSAKGFAPMRM